MEERFIPSPSLYTRHLPFSFNLKQFLQLERGEKGPERKRLKEAGITLSQTTVRTSDVIDDQIASSYSQPIAPLEDILLSTQHILATQTTVQNCLQKLVRRMTRFYVSLGATEAIKELTSVLEKLCLDWTLASETVVTVSSIDRRKSSLVFKATVFEIEGGPTLVDFRLSKGDGLEFKRHFLSVRSSIKPFIVRPPSDTSYKFPSTPSP